MYIKRILEIFSLTVYGIIIGVLCAYMVTPYISWDIFIIIPFMFGLLLSSIRLHTAKILIVSKIVSYIIGYTILYIAEELTIVRGMILFLLLIGYWSLYKVNFFKYKLFNIKDTTQ